MTSLIGWLLVILMHVLPMAAPVHLQFDDPTVRWTIAGYSARVARQILPDDPRDPYRTCGQRVGHLAHVRTRTPEDMSQALQRLIYENECYKVERSRG